MAEEHVDTSSWANFDPLFPGAYPDELPEELAWHRLFNLWDRDRDQYHATYNSMPADQQEDYDRWEDAWGTVLAVESTAEKGIPPWEDLLEMFLSKDSQNLHANLMAMTPQERYCYGEWAIDTMQQLGRMSADLHQTWASPRIDQHKHIAYWVSYLGLSSVGKMYYDGWLASVLAEQARAHKPLVEELYDIWLNTGGYNSRIWSQFRNNLVGQDGQGSGSAEFRTIQVQLEDWRFADEIAKRVAFSEKIFRTMSADDLAKTAAEFKLIFDLQATDQVAYLRAIDQLPWEICRAYNIWERRRMEALQ